MNASSCKHTFEVVVIAGVERVYCGRCRSAFTLRAAVAALAASEEAGKLVAQRLCMTTATLATIAHHNTWDGEGARKCLEAIGRGDLVPAAPRKAG